MQWNLLHSRQYRRTDVFFRNSRIIVNVPYNLVFFSMLARDSSCAMSGKLFNVKYQKINWSKIKIAEKWRCSNDNALKFLLNSFAWSLLGNTLGFSCAILFQSIKTTSNWILSCAMLPEASWGTLYKIFTCAMLPQEC